MVLVNGTAITGNGENGVFPEGRTVTLSSYMIGRYHVTYDLWYEVKNWGTANGYIFANSGMEGSHGDNGAAQHSVNIILLPRLIGKTLSCGAMLIVPKAANSQYIFQKDGK